MSDIVVRSSALNGRSRLLTFVIADIRGYTRFTHERGDEAATDLVGRFASVVRKAIDPHYGTVVEIRGDEILIAFESAREALRASVEMQSAFAEETESDPSFPLQVGIGVDAGEAVQFEGGYRSGALNLAARLCSKAAPGEVLASTGVVHLARKIEGLQVVSKGDVVFKGLADPVQVFEIVAAHEAAPEPAKETAPRKPGTQSETLRAAGIVGSVGTGFVLVGSLAAVLFGRMSRTDLTGLALAACFCLLGLLGSRSAESHPRMSAFLFLVASVAIVLTLSWSSILGVPLFVIAAGMTAFTRR